MSIRDDNFNWKKEALAASDSVEKALDPICDFVLENGMSFEDFFYIVCESAHLLILKRDRAVRKRLAKGSSRKESQ